MRTSEEISCYLYQEKTFLVYLVWTDLLVTCTNHVITYQLMRVLRLEALVARDTFMKHQNLGEFTKMCQKKKLNGILRLI